MHWLEILSSHQSADPGAIHIRLKMIYNPEAMPQRVANGTY